MNDSACKHMKELAEVADRHKKLGKALQLVGAKLLKKIVDEIDLGQDVTSKLESVIATISKGVDIENLAIEVEIEGCLDGFLENTPENKSRH